jgi:hypothetical protein
LERGPQQSIDLCLIYTYTEDRAHKGPLTEATA